MLYTNTLAYLNLTIVDEENNIWLDCHQENWGEEPQAQLKLLHPHLG